MLSTMSINGADVMDLSFLNQLEEERKTQKTVPICSTGFNGSKCLGPNELEHLDRLKQLERRSFNAGL